MPTQIIMYVIPGQGIITLADPGNENTIYIPYEINVPFSINDIVKGLNASNGISDLGDRYIVKFIINIPQ